MSSPKKNPFDEGKKGWIWKVAVAVAAYWILKVPAVAVAAAAGIGVAAWGVSKVLESVSEGVPKFLESVSEEPELVDDKKKMKAPGRNDEIICRDDFEDDPGGYFAAAAGMGITASGVSKFLESDSEEPEPVDNRKKMKTPGRNGEIIDRDDFEDDPRGVGVAVSKFHESVPKEPELVDDRKKMKAPEKNGKIIDMDDFKDDPRGVGVAVSKFRESVPKELELVDDRKKMKAPERNGKIIDRDDCMDDPRGVGVAVSKSRESVPKEPELVDDRKKMKAPERNGKIIDWDDFEDDPRGVGVAAWGVFKFRESVPKEPEPVDDKKKMKAPRRNGETIDRDDFENDQAGLSSPKLNRSQRKDGRRRVIFIRWKKPSQGWVGLNVDGASSGNPGPAGAGGLLRDERGEWIKGFYSNLGIASNTEAELWALIHGLKMAWDLGFKKIQVQSDSEAALYLVREADQASPHWNQVDEIRSMLTRKWDCRLEQVRREGNICADYLAKQGSKLKKKRRRKLRFGFKVLEGPPQDLTELLSNDMRGVTTPRTVKMSPKNQKNKK